MSKEETIIFVGWAVLAAIVIGLAAFPVIYILVDFIKSDLRRMKHRRPQRSIGRLLKGESRREYIKRLNDGK